MNKDKFLAELRAHIARKYITKREAAKAWRVSGPYVSGVVSGDKPVPEWMAWELGYKPVKSITYTFEEIDGGHK